MINFDKFLNWAEKRFGDVVVKGNEIRLNSIFTEDYKHKMWCNPTGGKYNIPHGVYHCWKTDEKGTLVKLVMKVDKCSYDEALEILDTGNQTIAELEAKVIDFYMNKTKNKENDFQNQNLNFPEHTYSIKSLPECDYYRMSAEMYLEGRKLPVSDYFVCIDGDYNNRIVIPYYNQKNELIYYNCRSLDKKSKLKYLGPPKEIGIGKGDVVYVPNWYNSDEKIYITEGEFDAKSISLCGYNSAAVGGKYLTENQAIILKKYIPVLALDNDKAGKEALEMMANSFISKGFEKIYYIRPPNNFKDWNELLIKININVMKEYLKKINVYDIQWGRIKYVTKF